MAEEQNTQEEKTYKCTNCGSESKGEAGECCGGTRKEACAECKDVEGKCTCG